MRVCVYGMYHQGSVTAACLAELGVKTVGVDDDAAVVEALKKGKAPLFEPGLDKLLKAGLDSGVLEFTTDRDAAVRTADLVWIAFDTPVDESDEADIEFVKNRVKACYPHLRDDAIVLITAQLPIGSAKELESAYEASGMGRKVHFASAPENLRLGKALETFRHADRLVVGIRDEYTQRALEPLLRRLTDNLIWVSVESAEMTKHATNAFLAASVTLANEIATLCERSGADAREVELGLRAEPRIGKQAYIRPGPAFGGGTLARDVVYLSRLATRTHCSVPVLETLLKSNEQHRLWAVRQLELRLGALTTKTAGILGLAYKPGTDSTRRSVALELCRTLSSRGMRVQAFDPKVTRLPSGLDAVSIMASAADAARGADALIVATEWPEFQQLDVAATVDRMAGALILDQGRFLEKLFATEPRVTYVTVGKPL